MKHNWFVAGDFETHCKFCFDTWRNNEYAECSYSSNVQEQGIGTFIIPEELPELTDEEKNDAFDYSITRFLEIMSKPVCKECIPLLKQGLPSPLWHCPHKGE